MSEINPRDVNIGSEVLSGGLARAVLMGIGFIGSIIFARVLGASGFGAFYLLVTLENVVDRPLIGLGEAVKKRMTEEGSDVSGLFGGFLLIMVVFVGLMVVCVLIFQEWVNGYVDHDQAYVFFIILLVGLAANDALTTVFGATGRFGLVNWVDALRSLLTIPSQVVLILVGYGVAGMVWGLTGASLLTTVLVVYFLQIPPTLPSREGVRSVLEYAKFSVPSALTSFSYDRIALLLIGFSLGPTIAGYFEASLKLTIPAIALGSIASGILMPKISQNASTGEEITKDLRNVMNYSSIFAIPVFFGVVALSQQLVVTVYGDEFAPAANLLVGVALFRLITTRTSPLIQTLRGLDRPDLDLYTTLGALIVLFGMGGPAMYYVGVIGIVGGLVASAATRYILAVVFIHREAIKSHSFGVPFITQSVAGGVMFGVLVVLESTLILSPWYWVVGLVGIGGLVYFTVLFIISPDIRTTTMFVLDDFLTEKVVWK